MVRRLAWAGAPALLLGLLSAAWIAWPLPPGLLATQAVQSLTITDRHGVMLRSTRAPDGSLARWVRLEEMDPDLPRAFVAVEDVRFYRHGGVDFRSVIRAARDNLRAARIVSGASTITMQLARLLNPSGRGWGGKLVQVLWALRLERHLSKQRILEEYLNRVPLGQGAIGVGAAMALYFGGSPQQVSLGQAALLAALAREPSSQNPLVSPAGAAARRRVGLERLVGEGYASREEAARAGREPVLSPGDGRPFLAPHFTSRLLFEEESRNRPLAGTWRTSLDLELQAAVENEVRHTTAELADRGARQAAAVVLDNQTGEVLAWVGSPDFWADTAGQVDMVISPRQPGSALKPFLYALAFDRGVTPATVLADIPRTYQTSSGPYHPRNYDRRFHGPVRAREALGSSYNLPAVAVADRIGYGSLYHGLREAGFTSLDQGADHYGLGLALGNGDVTLLELANGYRALANGGLWRPWRWFAAEPGEPAPGPERRFASSRAAAQVLDILGDPVARIPGFGLSTPFDWPFRAAAKTGTSRHFTDNWAVAATANFTVAVWAGNFSGQPMDGVSGVTGAGPLLHRVVLLVARRYPPGELVQPMEAGLVPVRICRLSGGLAGPRCPPMTEWFAPGTEPSQPCPWHVEGEVVLPVEYAEWQAGADPAVSTAVPGYTEATGTRYSVPGTQYRVPSTQSPFHIVSPLDGDIYRIPPGIESRYATVALRSAGVSSPGMVRWYVDGRPVRSGRWALEPGAHTVGALAPGGRSDQVRIVVE
jgi:penicillin-binding protein 1C